MRKIVIFQGKNCALILFGSESEKQKKNYSNVTNLYNKISLYVLYLKLQTYLYKIHINIYKTIGRRSLPSKIHLLHIHIY